MVGGKCAYVLMLLLVAVEGCRIAKQMKMLPTDIGGSSSCWMVLLGKMRYVELNNAGCPSLCLVVDCQVVLCLVMECRIVRWCCTW